MLRLISLFPHCHSQISVKAGIWFEKRGTLMKNFNIAAMVVIFDISVEDCLQRDISMLPHGLPPRCSTI